MHNETRKIKHPICTIAPEHVLAKENNIFLCMYLMIIYRHYSYAPQPVAIAMPYSVIPLCHEKITHCCRALES